MNKIAKNIAPNDDVATTVNKIAEKNNINNVNLIVVGETLDLDVSGVSGTSTQVATTEPASTTASQPVQATVAPATTTTPQASTTPAQSTTQASTSTASTISGSNSDALNALIARESGGNTGATNGQYYGIGQLSPQARAIYGGNSSDYNDQLNAMKAYIAARYGTAENAYAHSNATGWY